MVGDVSVLCVWLTTCKLSTYDSASLSTHVSVMSFACPHLAFSLLPASMSADVRTQSLTRHLVSAKTKSSGTHHRTSSSHLLLHIIIIIIDISTSSSSSLLSKAMEDIPSHGEHGHPRPCHREKFTAAMLVAAGKVEKTDKGETPTEVFVRINAAQVIKENRQRKECCSKEQERKETRECSQKANFQIPETHRKIKASHGFIAEFEPLHSTVVSG
jgi:hypothetical protein